VTLFLLDTNIPENPPALREITGRLYGGDKEMRIRQEVLLGVGGLRALRALGITPAVCHMNEGHSAFLALERIRQVREEHDCDLATAQELVWASNVFTTHTPVPAGNERFDPGLVRKYMEPLASGIGLSWDRFLALGREDPENTEEAFCMTVLAIKLAAHCNAVSRLHGYVSREMWQGLFPEIPVDEIPIGHVTNGVHARGWLSHDHSDLFQRYLGPRFVEEPMDFTTYDRIEEIPAIEVWRTHERRRERLVHFARQRLRRFMERRGAPPSDIQAAEEVLDPRALTIGFARRFATYKRATLLLRDRDRLARILGNEEQPVQLIFAGKAHPHDNPGKELIKAIVHLARDPRFRHKVVFLEDYDAAVARYMTQGCDIWLNTPRRPLEASGTSGMKAAMNGVLNCSILDGWWDEGYTPDNGFAIGSGEQYADTELQDAVESKALYDLIERDIVPTFYARGRDGLPREWVQKMKNSMRELGRYFNTSRMLAEYSGKYYTAAAGRYRDLSSEGLQRARQLAEWRAWVREKWPEVAIESVDPDEKDLTRLVGDCLTVRAKVNTGSLQAHDLRVRLWHGTLASGGQGIEDPEAVELQPQDGENGPVTFEGCIECRRSGQYGFAVQVLPKHPDLVHPYDGRCVRWA
jgi:starch phosphorylase